MKNNLAINRTISKFIYDMACFKRRIKKSKKKHKLVKNVKKEKKEIFEKVKI